MNVLINYADSKYESARKWNTWTGKYIAGFDKIYAFCPSDIDEEFKSANAKAFSTSRGNGLWLWKPYFIDKVLNSVRDGDIVFYCDSGTFFTRSPKMIYEKLTEENPLFVCDIPLIESCWTKPQCFVKMGLTDEKYKISNQIIGTYFVLKVNDFTRRFVKEWLKYCCDYDLLSPAGLTKNEMPQYNYGERFVAHREDQSIFSLLCKKYGIMPHKDISQRGNDPHWYYSPYYFYKEPVHLNDQYKGILFLHKQEKLSMRFFLSYLKYKIKKIKCL